jgi:hypothetical protein
MTGTLTEESVAEAVRHVTRILYPETWRSWDWPVSVKSSLRGKRHRKWEKEVLFALANSGPTNKYRLAGEKCRLHYTQVTRAVSSLLRRGAIMPDSSSREWRTGRMSVNYRPTTFGYFLVLCSKLLVALRYEPPYGWSPVLADSDIRCLSECLNELATEYKSNLLRELTETIMSIADERRRNSQLVTLARTVYEAEEKLADPFWQLPALTAFACQAWNNLEDVRAYRKPIPAECRMLLARTREHIIERMREIDAILKP